MSGKIIIKSNRFDSKVSSKSNRFDSIAEELVSRFHDASGKWFYYKVAKTLSRSSIDRLVGVTKEMNPKNPAAYFNALAVKEMETWIAENGDHYYVK